MARIETIGVIGAGAWGTALAQAVSRAGRRAVLFARDPELARAIASAHRNPRYLADLALDPDIEASADLAAAAGADVLLLAVPAQALRGLARQLPPSEAPLVICAKGFEAATGARLSQVVASERPASTVAVLSGPNFAREVAAGLPAAATLGASDRALGQAACAGAQQRELPALLDRRPERRRGRRRGQERARDRRRDRRRPRPRRECPGGPDHPRPGRACAARRGAGREARRP